MARTALAESQAATRRVLFIDGDNHCGSRFCEELFNHLARAGRARWLAFSRASSRTPAWHTSGPMCPIATEALRRRGARVGDPLRLPLECSSFDLQVADLAIALEEERDRPALEMHWPKPAAAVRYWKIGRDCPSPVVKLAHFDRLVRQLFAELNTPSEWATAAGARRRVQERREECAIALGHGRFSAPPRNRHMPRSS